MAEVPIKHQLSKGYTCRSLYGYPKKLYIFAICQQAKAHQNISCKLTLSLKCKIKIAKMSKRNDNFSFSFQKTVQSLARVLSKIKPTPWEKVRNIKHSNIDGLSHYFIVITTIFFSLIR
jgi:hypothetical protein